MPTISPDDVRFRIRRQTAALAAEADRLNAERPVGTVVRFWKGAKDGPGQVSRIRSAHGIVGRTIVVWFDEVSGCVAASHVEPIGRDAA